MSSSFRDALWIHPAYLAQLERADLSSTAALCRFGSDGEVVTRGRNKLLTRRRLGELTVYTKTYRYEPPTWRYLGRKSRAERELCAYESFDRLEIPHPDVLCVAEERRWGRVAASLIMTREIAGSQDLVKRFLSLPAAAPQRREALRRLGEYARRMCAGKFLHGTYRFRNVLWQSSADGTETLHLLDCPCGRRRGLRDSVLFDLASLYKDARVLCSPEEWQVCLAAYAGQTANGAILASLGAAVSRLCWKLFGPPPIFDRAKPTAELDRLFR